MTRLAVLADVHANLAALEAVLAEIAAIGVDGYLVAGDMVGGPQPNEVLDRLRALENCWMIRGNNENYHVRLAEKTAPEAWWICQQMAFVRWSYLHLKPDHCRFIAELPEQRVVAEAARADVIRLVHGSPRSASEYLLPDTHPELFALAMQQTREPVVIFGHTHRVWMVQQDGRLAFNPGSVGVPMDGDARAQYALLTSQNSHWEVEFRRVAYDLDEIQRAFRESGLLAYGGAFSRGYLYDILTGRDILPDFVRFAYQLTEEAGFQQCLTVPDEIWQKADATYPWPADCPGGG